MLRGEESTLPEKDPDIGSQIDTWFLFFAVLMLLLTFLLTTRVTNQLQDKAIAEDRLLVNLVSKQLTLNEISEAWFVLPQFDDAYGLIALDQSGELVFSAQLPTGETSDHAQWANWQNSIAQTARRSEKSTFYSSAPNGDRWLHSASEMQSGFGYVVLQRSTTDAFSTARWVSRWMLGIAFMVLLGLSLFRPFFHRRLITPIGQLGEFSNVFRLRGRLQKDELRVLEKLSKRKDQIGTLASSLQATEQQTQKRLVELETLLETSRSVVISLDVNEVIDNILLQVQRLFQVERCAVVTLDERANVFRVRASRGLSDTYVDQLRITPSEPSSPSMRALRQSKPVQVSDTDADMSYEQFRQRADREGFKSVLSIPLRTNHARPAVLNLYKSNPYRYSYSELEIAASFANHASSAVDNAALYERSDERLQAQTQRLEAIVESLSDGLIMESLDGEILYCNQRAAAMLGVSEQVVKGQQSADIRTLLWSTAIDPPAELDDIVLDVTRALENGRLQDLRIHTFDIEDARGKQIGRGQLWPDITPDKELDRMKSTLLSAVSHELRTTLATIKGYASTLLAKDVAWDEQTQHEFLQTISDETDRMTGLVKDLLDMSRIEAGLLDIQSEPMLLNSLVNQVIQAMPKDQQRRLRLTLSETLPFVDIDSSRISTVIRNLIDNAAKYSSAETPIEVSSYQQADTLCFTVRDYGLGVAEIHKTKIFEQFFRADNGLTRQTGWVGLGLAICKGFIEGHNGSIWMTREEVGSTFGFSLPVASHNEDNEDRYVSEDIGRR